MMTRLTGDLEASPRGPRDALTVARAWGGRSTPITRALFEDTLFPQVPEIPAAVRSGRWLDIGCGVATTTLTLATLIPSMRATGLELVPEVAAEAVARAAALGVGDRVDIRAMDARDFTEESAFAGGFWAQPFFPSASRPATLAMIRRALRPGALLLLQEMEPAPAPDQRAAYALRRPVFSGWEIPFGRTAEELATEAQDAGFDLIRMGSRLGKLAGGPRRPGRLAIRSKASASWTTVRTRQSTHPYYPLLSPPLRARFRDLGELRPHTSPNSPRSQKPGSRDVLRPHGPDHPPSVGPTERRPAPPTVSVLPRPAPCGSAPPTTSSLPTPRAHTPRCGTPRRHQRPTFPHLRPP
jgi:SAM-dependent methyltransferase